MVVSRIDKSITYSENQDVNPIDKKKKSQLYQIMVHGLNVIIAIGTQKNTTKNISYFPIYLVKNNNTVIQIGLYEILTNKINKYIDPKSRTLFIEKLESPLIYDFATKEIIQKNRKIPPTMIKEDELLIDENLLSSIEVSSKIDPLENKKDIFTHLKNTVIQKPLPKESRKDALDIRQKYHPSENDNWVNQFMQNKYYFIDIVEGSDTCFFTAIKDAFSTIGYFTTVEKIKSKLGTLITDGIFQRFKNHYDMLSELDESQKEKIKQLQKRNSELKIKITQTINAAIQQQIKLEGENNLKLFNKLKKDKTVVEAYLQEYRFLKGVTTTEEFIKKIKSCDFWVETWAISIVEKMLNVKFIILNNDEYKQNDLSNVLNCGHKTVNEMYHPDFYIILTKSKNVYHLVSYKNRKIFTTTEVPYDIKKIIHDKCIEDVSGDFKMIHEYANYETEPAIDPKYIDLFDDNTVFRFYEKSANRVPGKGNGEKINIERVVEFMNLGGIPDWRKKLANTWVQPFALDGHKWSSVEHYFQASKFKKNNPDFYLDFSLDSNSELSKNVDMAKAVGNDIHGKYKGVVIKEPHVHVDPSFSSTKNKALHDAQYAKFSQNKDLHYLLQSTKNAKLIYHVKQKRPEIYYELMVVRDELST